MSATGLFVMLVVGLCLIFTYTNGFQDGSSVAAGAIASRAMTRLQAVALVAVCEFLGAFFGGSAVANTIGSITSWPSEPRLLPVLASSLFAAIVWNYATKLLRVPSSSTHALVGGIIGSVVTASGGWQFIVWGTPGHIIHPTGVWKVILSLFISPLLGFAGGYICFALGMFLLMRATTRINKWLKLSQWLSVGALAFGHGSNDTQKAMGVIVLALNAAGWTHNTEIPLWVRTLVGLLMSAGIISLVPGIVRRVGRIYRMRPFHGLATEVASAAIVLAGSATGGPVSASQIIASTVMGVGTAERRKGVHWLIARDMLVAWFLTIPCSGLLACCTYEIFFRWMSHTAFGG